MTETVAKDRIERAVSEREEATASLHRDDGSMLYADEEHEERLAAIGQEHAAAFDAIEADVERSIERAEEDLLKLEHADPTDLLSNEELERASAKSPFVLNECMNLPPEALTKRLSAVLASGDRPTMFLHAQHAALRVGESPRPDHRDPGGAREEEGAQEIREAVSKLAAGLDPGRERRLAGARASLEEARSLKRDAYFRRLGAANAGDLYARRKYGLTA